MKVYKLFCSCALSVSVPDIARQFNTPSSLCDDVTVIMKTFKIVYAPILKLTPKRHEKYMPFINLRKLQNFYTHRNRAGCMQKKGCQPCMSYYKSDKG